MKEFWLAIKVPLATLGGLLALLTATTLYAFLPHAPLKPEVAGLIALAKASLVVFVFMRLRQADGLPKVAAIAGVMWLMLLFGLGWVDYASR